jgi:hypothetical protein
VGTSDGVSPTLQLAGPRYPSGRPMVCAVWKFGLLLMIAVAAIPLPAREKDAIQYGMGLIVNIPLPDREVTQVVQEVVQNGIIRGTKEYNNDQYLSGATTATSTRAFPEWTEGGKVFYKIRLKALDPRDFKNTNDTGTVAVRYVVQAQDDKHTVLRIDARFVEDSRHVVRASDGSVESAEYKDIHDHLDAVELMKAQTVESQKGKEESSSKRPQTALMDETATSPPPAAATTAPAEPTIPTVTTSDPAESQSAGPPQTLEQRVLDLRKQVERLVKAPGAPLKSAPFHTASTLQSLKAGTEVLVVISTPYWLGVETHEGQHGWILRNELEQLP